MEIDRIGQTLESLKRNEHYKVLLDMTNVDHIHYRVMKHLVASAEGFRDQDGDIKMAQLSDETKQVIQFTGADQYLEDYATISEAILSFLNKVDERDSLFQ